MWILLALASLTATHTRAETPLPVHVGGRTVVGRDGSRTFGWPAVYFESRFRGSTVRVRFEAKDDFLRLLVDGREQKLFRRPGIVDLQVTGLTNGLHTIRLEKLTESQEGASRFVGFYASRGLKALPVQRPPLQIEFIGDSYTVGYGNMSGTRTCTKAEVHDRTNSQRAFGPLVARSYGADYRLNAYSGIGIVRNYDGSAPGVTMPRLYWHALPQLTAPLSPSEKNWRPRLIVVNLGTNDFSTPIHAGERWASQSALEKDYVATYVEFISSLRTRQPQAAIILMGSELFYPKVEQVASRLKRTGIRRIVTLRFGGLDLGGCDYHPSQKDHQKLAVQLKGAIDGARLLAN